MAPKDTGSVYCIVCPMADVVVYKSDIPPFLVPAFHDPPPPGQIWTLTLKDLHRVKSIPTKIIERIIFLVWLLG